MKIQIGFKLESIPNEHGFRFRGVEHNGDLTNCIVINVDGLHKVFRESDGLPFYSELRGWMQHLPNRPAGVFQNEIN